MSARPLHQHVTERRRHDHSPPARQIQIESSNFPACLSCNLNPPPFPSLLRKINDRRGLFPHSPCPLLLLLLLPYFFT